MKYTKLLKGNHALAEGGIAAGCRYFFGYPITPQSEFLEHMAEIMPEANGEFVQAESEVAAINMVIGAASCGAKVMTGTSGPGFDLFHEGIGNLHAHDFPVVIVDIMRGGPGNGSLHPSQQDYDVCIKSRGDMKNIVLAPWNHQDMYDLPNLAFELAFKYRNPVVIMADNVIGQSYGNVVMDDEFKPTEFDTSSWAMSGAKGRERHLSIAHFPDPNVANEMQHYKQGKYAEMAKNEQRSESYYCDDDPEVVVVAYGIMARNSYAAVKALREQGYKVGLFRPVTLFPYPMDALNEATKNAKHVLVAEMSAGQMCADIKGRGFDKDVVLKPGFCPSSVPGTGEIEAWIKELL